MPMALLGDLFGLQVIRQDETWENLFESAGLEVKLMISPPLALEKEAAVQEFLKDKVGELLTFSPGNGSILKGNFMFQPSFSEG